MRNANEQPICACKIAAAGKACLFSRQKSGFVSETAARVAQDPERRKAVKRGQSVQRNVSKYRWEVKWSDDRTPAQAIVDRLLGTDPDLAIEVLRILRADSDKNRRSLA
jgi:hypothetical protein